MLGVNKAFELNDVVSVKLLSDLTTILEYLLQHLRFQI